MNNPAPFWLDPSDASTLFPDVSLALHEPDGLLAIGGDLSAKRLESAYKNCIFPWYNSDQPILWWSPDPRAVLYPEKIKISRSLRKSIKKGHISISFDKSFKRVIDACRMSRRDSEGTWITTDMRDAYCNLHRLGSAHSVEAWVDNQLVGGLYGLAFGQVFFGESMFSTVTDASKIAFVALAEQLIQWDYKLIDCQVKSAHLSSLGDEDIARSQFKQMVSELSELPVHPEAWSHIE